MTAKYAFINSEEGNYSIRSMCRWARVSRAGYYEWLNRPVSVTQRWRDLLIAECVALQTLRDLQIPAAQARWFDADGFTFLEVDRFDRVGARGRRGVLSLWALDHEFYGRGHDWRALADAMQSDRRLSGAEAARVRWLDVFGALIGNSDRHLGNLSVFAEGAAHQCTLAPVYDMLPMHFAPAQLQLPRREYVVTAPRAETWSVWADAARAALTFWQRLSNERALSDDFRALATASGEALATAQQRFGFLS